MDKYYPQDVEFPGGVQLEGQDADFPMPAVTFVCVGCQVEATMNPWYVFEWYAGDGELLEGHRCCSLECAEKVYEEKCKKQIHDPERWMESPEYQEIEAGRNKYLRELGL